MNKMNKKGFTLIEMLVVIAIIAVLVAIIIPTVTSSTDKAAAATDAANLRSAKAVVTTKMLEGTYGKDVDSIDAATLGIPATSKYDGSSFSCKIVQGVVTVAYGDNGITYFSNIAGSSSSDGHTHNYSTEVKNDEGTVTGYQCSCGDVSDTKTTN